MNLFQLVALPSINIDLTPLFAYFAEFSGKSLSAVMGRLFLDGGWILILAVFIWGIWHVYLMRMQLRYGRGLKWILLAIDVPKETEQSPKAVEYMFAQLCGGYRGLVKKELYLEGKTQFFFSIEIVSIDGYVQFFIRTVDQLRELVEAAIYSQYPDAQISEVEDYTSSIPREWPQEKHDFWGTEYILGKPWAYPIRTWPDFEHSLSAELKDPLALLLESMSRMRKGEQFWVQIILTPTLDDWKQDGEKVLNKILGRKAVTSKPGLWQKTLELPAQTAVELAHHALTGKLPERVEEKKERDESHFKMLGMTRGDREVVEGIQMKLAKPGFWTKFRFIYLAEKPVFTKGPRIALIHGFLRQFASLSSNSFRPYGLVTPKSDYFWQRHKIFDYLSAGFYKTKYTRQKKLMLAYRVRSNWRGAPAYILNIEELATLWHFPVRTVKAPLIKKTEAKRAEPPFTLPRERLGATRSKTVKGDEGDEGKGAAPGNLPIT